MCALLSMFWDQISPHTARWEVKTHLVALAVVLQAARSLAVAAFAVPAVRLALFAFTDFRFKGLRISVQTRL